MGTGQNTRRHIARRAFALEKSMRFAKFVRATTTRNRRAIKNASGSASDIPRKERSRVEIDRMEQRVDSYAESEPSWRRILWRFSKRREKRRIYSYGHERRRVGNSALRRGIPFQPQATAPEVRTRAPCAKDLRVPVRRSCAYTFSFRRRELSTPRLPVQRRRTRPLARNLRSNYEQREPSLNRPETLELGTSNGDLSATFKRNSFFFVDC